nr:MAG TPA: hypothetical protein [Caudoviricetes sp.]
MIYCVRLLLRGKNPYGFIKPDCEIYTKRACLSKNGKESGYYWV